MRNASYGENGQTVNEKVRKTHCDLDQLLQSDPSWTQRGEVGYDGEVLKLLKGQPDLALEWGFEDRSGCGRRHGRAKKSGCNHQTSHKPLCLSQKRGIRRGTYLKGDVNPRREGKRVWTDENGSREIQSERPWTY